MDEEDHKRRAEDARAILDEVLAPGRTAQEVMGIYKRWADYYEEDLAHLGYCAPAMAADELGVVLGERKHARILDCAAGTGLVGQELASRGFTSLDALDPCQALLDKAELKGVYTHLICDFMGPNRLNMADNTYDALIAVGCFAEGHVKTDCFEELFRITKPGGPIIMTVPVRFLHNVEALKDNKLDNAIKRHQDNGACRMRLRREVHINEDYIIFCLEAC